MSRNHIPLFVVVLIGVFTATAAQVVCLNPIEIGELRVKNSKECVNIEGSSGSGNINTWKCDGYDDQQIIMCGDGSIRNMKTPNNCFTAGTSGNGNLKSSPCKVYPALPDYQKWRFGRSKSYTDSFGIRQNAREIINVKSGECINVEGSVGTGDIDTHRCENADDQYFFIRSKGKLMKHGRLQVQESGLCLDVESGSSRPSLGDNVRIYECGNSANQYFNFYESGEIVNKESRLCVNVAGYSGSGNIDLFACDYFDDQSWFQPRSHCVGDYCSFFNKKSENCLNVHGTAAKSNSNVYTLDCTGERDQRFKWITATWVTPTATWSLVGCNMNGEVTQSISNTVSYSSSISHTLAIEVSASIEAGTSFGSASLTTTVSTSLSNEWTESQEQSQEITFTCQYYDNNQPFLRGCMWQLQINTRQTVNTNPLVWKPQIVKCTSRNVAPTCAPFTGCQDQACTMCVGTSGKKKREYSVKRSFWKKLSTTYK